jgi:hypothetical protein
MIHATRVILAGLFTAFNESGLIFGEDPHDFVMKLL